MQKNGISTYSDKKISVGDIRKTQLITTYGVGAIVDFKNDTVVIASTDDWDYSPNDAGEVENRKKFSFFKELHQLFGFFFCDMSCSSLDISPSLSNSFMLLLSVCRYPHHIAYSALIFTCPTSSFPKKQIKQNIHNIFYKNEYHRRLLSPKRAAVSTLRYFSVRYSFLSNNCSIERFLNLGMLYPNGELRAFTKSFV